MRSAIIISFVIVLETFSCLMFTGKEKNVAMAEDKRQNTIDRARCANAVYDVGKKKHQTPPGFELFRESTAGKDGFQAAAYRNKETGQIVIAYRGTEITSPSDLATDYQLSTGSKKSATYDSQVAQALKFYNEVKQNSGGSDIAVTGHSLGGHLAQIVGAKNEVPTETFNAPGVSEETLKKNGITINKSLPIVNRVRDSDPVGNFGNHIGQVIKYPDHGYGGDPEGIGEIKGYPYSAIDNHSMDSFERDIEKRKDLDYRTGEFKDFTSMGVDATDAKLNERRAREATESGNESYKEDNVESKSRKGSNSDWENQLANSMSNAAKEVNANLEAQKKAQEAKRLAYIDAENRKRVEENKKIEQNRRHIQEMQAKAYEDEKLRMKAEAQKETERSKCRSEIELLKHQSQGIASELKKELADIMAGEYCSECQRSKSEIERTGQSFSDHLKKAKGKAVRGSKDLINKKYAEYNNKKSAIKEKITGLEKKIQDTYKK